MGNLAAQSVRNLALGRMSLDNVLAWHSRNGRNCLVALRRLPDVMQHHWGEMHARHVRCQWIRRQKKYQTVVRVESAAFDLADDLVDDAEDPLYLVQDFQVSIDFEQYFLVKQT